MDVGFNRDGTGSVTRIISNSFSGNFWKVPVKQGNALPFVSTAQKRPQKLDHLLPESFQAGGARLTSEVLRSKRRIPQPLAAQQHSSLESRGSIETTPALNHAFLLCVGKTVGARSACWMEQSNRRRQLHPLPFDTPRAKRCTTDLSMPRTNQSTIYRF